LVDFHSAYLFVDGQVYVNRVEVIQVNDLRTVGGIIHSLNGSLSPTLNRCDKLTADHQLASVITLIAVFDIDKMYLFFGNFNHGL